MNGINNMIFKTMALLNLFLIMEIIVNAAGPGATSLSYKPDPCKISGVAGKIPDDACLMHFMMEWGVPKCFPEDVKKYSEVVIKTFHSNYCIIGAPGTGKKNLVRAMARETGTEIREYDFDEIMKNKGKAKELNRIYNEAHEYIKQTEKPIVLLFKNIDKDREYAWLLNCYIDAELGNPYVFTVITIHNRDDIDYAPYSRYDTIELPLPDDQDRAEIIKFFAKKHNLTVSDIFAKTTAASCPEAVGADIEKRFTNALGEPSMHRYPLCTKIKILHEFTKPYDSITVGSTLLCITIASVVILGWWHGNLSSMAQHIFQGKFKEFYKDLFRKSNLTTQIREHNDH